MQLQFSNLNPGASSLVAGATLPERGAGLQPAPRVSKCTSHPAAASTRDPPVGMFVCSHCGRLWLWADLAAFSKHPELRLCENCVQIRDREQLERGEFVITLRPEPGEWDSPPIVRLRLLLKRALRVFRLRCVRLEFGTPTPALAERGHT